MGNVQKGAAIAANIYRKMGRQTTANAAPTFSVVNPLCS